MGKGKGKGKGKGNDTGGSGTGRGGKPPEDKDGTKVRDTFIGGKFDLSGKIVGISTFKGLPEKAEAKAEYAELYSRFQKSLEETQSKENIPVEYKEYIKKYFDSIRPSGGGGD
jgi:hypothetical protein